MSQCVYGQGSEYQCFDSANAISSMCDDHSNILNPYISSRQKLLGFLKKTIGVYGFLVHDNVITLKCNRDVLESLVGVNSLSTCRKTRGERIDMEIQYVRYTSHFKKLDGTFIIRWTTRKHGKVNRRDMDFCPPRWNLIFRMFKLHCNAK